MKERILRLCKRLNKFSLDDITSIVDDMEETTIQLILLMLASEGKIVRKDDLFLYINQVPISESSLPTFFQFHTKEKIDLIIKCFCADISAEKTGLLVELSRNTINNFYSYFRSILYENQLKELEVLYKEHPKTQSERNIFNNKFYLFNYGNKIYVSKKMFEPTSKATNHTKEEMRLIKNTYCKIRSVFHSHKFTKSMVEYSYGKLWLQEYSQQEKENYINYLLNKL